MLGKPPEDEWPKTDVPIKWNSFEVVNQVTIYQISPNICDTAQDLIMVSTKQKSLTLHVQFLYMPTVQLSYYL